MSDNPKIPKHQDRLWHLLISALRYGHYLHLDLIIAADYFILSVLRWLEVNRKDSGPVKPTLFLSTKVFPIIPKSLFLWDF